MSNDILSVTKLELFAMFAPEPKEDIVQLEQQYDRNRNPHNLGPPKPHIRGRDEIIAKLKFDYAVAMLAESVQRQKHHH